MLACPPLLYLSTIDFLLRLYSLNRVAVVADGDESEQVELWLNWRNCLYLFFASLTLPLFLLLN